jgi:hypothetical protein
LQRHVQHDDIDCGEYLLHYVEVLFWEWDDHVEVLVRIFTVSLAHIDNKGKRHGRQIGSGSLMSSTFAETWGNGLLVPCPTSPFLHSHLQLGDISSQPQLDEGNVCQGFTGGVEFRPWHTS